MRVLITGASGFIGSHLAEYLHAKGYGLRCLVRKTSNLAWLRELPIEYVYGDLCDGNVFSDALDGVDYVYHLAGVTVAKAKTKADYFRGNTQGTAALLHATLNRSRNLKRFVYVSSQAAVGPTLNGSPIDEDTPFHPISAYGISKMEAEKECLKLMHRLPINIVRPPVVYGPRDRDVFTFFSSMSKGLQAMVGFNNKETSLVHVKDLVNGMTMSAEHPKAGGQTYFISSERFYNWKEIGAVTASIMGKRARRIRVPESVVYALAGFAEAYGLATGKSPFLKIEKARDIVQDAWTCSVERAKRELGYRQTVTLEEGIRDTVKWYRDRGWIEQSAESIAS